MCFNPSTGLMFIPAYYVGFGDQVISVFQSLDWVDVYSGWIQARLSRLTIEFQSLDWVDVYSGTDWVYTKLAAFQFQSLDWVDVYSGVNFCLFLLLLL